ncbi:hypothetical protein TNCV_1496121 [Trichonephila clavipes]|nr:hypothetical protein TNCV_1496121 [Trichonephila clavipes]
MNETTQQEKTTQLSSRNETTQLVSRNETTQLVSRNETTQLCTAVDRLQPPATAYNAYNRLQPPTTACNRLQPPATAYNRLQPPATAYNRLQPPATACTAFTAESAFSTYCGTYYRSIRTKFEGQCKYLEIFFRSFSLTFWNRCLMSIMVLGNFGIIFCSSSYNA